MANLTVQNFLDMAGTKSYGILFLDEHQQLQKAETASNPITRMLQTAHDAKAGEGRRVREAFENALRTDARFQSKTMQDAITRALGDDDGTPYKFTNAGVSLERRCVKQIINQVLDEYHKHLDVAQKFGFTVDQVDLLRRELPPAEVDGFVKRLGAANPEDVDLFWDLATACADAKKRADARNEMAFMLTYEDSADPDNAHRSAFVRTLREKITAKYGTFDHTEAEERLVFQLNSEYLSIAGRDRFGEHKLLTTLRKASDGSHEDVVAADAAFEQLSRLIDATVDKIGISMKRDANLHTHIAWAGDVALGDALAKVYGENLSSYHEHRAKLDSFMKAWVDETFLDLRKTQHLFSLSNQIDDINASAAEMASFLVSAEGASAEERMKFMANKVVVSTFTEKDYMKYKGTAFRNLYGYDEVLSEAVPSYPEFTQMLTDSAYDNAVERLRDESEQDKTVIFDATARFVRLVREEMKELKSMYSEKLAPVQDAFSAAVRTMQHLCNDNKKTADWDLLHKYDSFKLMEDPLKHNSGYCEWILKKHAYDKFAPYLKTFDGMVSKEDCREIDEALKGELTSYVKVLGKTYRDFKNEVRTRVIDLFHELPNVKGLPEKAAKEINDMIDKSLDDLCGQATMREFVDGEEHEDLQEKIYHQLNLKLESSMSTEVDVYLDKRKDGLFELHAELANRITEAEKEFDISLSAENDFPPVALLGNRLTAANVLDADLKQLFNEQLDQLALNEFERREVLDKKGKVIDVVRQPLLARAEMFVGWDLERVDGEIDRCQKWLNEHADGSWKGKELDQFKQKWKNMSVTIRKLDEALRHKITNRVPDAALANCMASTGDVLRQVVISIAESGTMGHKFEIDKTAQTIADLYIEKYESYVKDNFDEKKVNQFDEKTGDELIHEVRDALDDKIDEDDFREESSVLMKDLENAMIPVANKIRQDMIANAGKVVPTVDDFRKRIDKVLDDALKTYGDFRKELAKYYGEKTKEDPRFCRDTFGPMHQYFAALISGKSVNDARKAIYSEMDKAVACARQDSESQLALDAANELDNKLSEQITAVKDSLSFELGLRNVPEVPGFDDFLSRFKKKWDYADQKIAAKTVGKFFREANTALEKFQNGYLKMISKVEDALIDVIGKDSELHKEFVEHPNSPTATLLKSLLAVELAEKLRAYANAPDNFKYDGTPFKKNISGEIERVQAEYAQMA